MDFKTLWIWKAVRGEGRESYERECDVVKVLVKDVAGSACEPFDARVQGMLVGMGVMVGSLGLEWFGAVLLIFAASMFLGALISWVLSSRAPGRRWLELDS